MVLDPILLVAFVVGLVLGILIVAWIAARRQAEQVQTLEASWRQKAKHLADEVGGADTAHEETKSRLRDAQAALAQARTAVVRLEEEREAAANRATELEKHLEEARAALGQAKARAEHLEIELKKAHEAELHVRQQLDTCEAERRRLAAAAAPAPVQAAAAFVALPSAPEGAGDDLTVIKGIGDVLAEKLRGLGIRSFAQLAALTPEQARQIDDAIDFPGRVEREHWIEQARDLTAKG